jgi:glycosyltransferase involved in cell wall biosynthesis
VSVKAIDRLPADAVYICLGASWWFPQVWEFAAKHKTAGGTVVQMVYDLIPLVFPEYYTPREPPAFIAWLNRSLEYATRFVCISEWTANDLRKYASEHDANQLVRAVPLAHEFVGFDRTTRIEKSAALSQFDSQEYVLCVGTIEYRKNNLAMLQIWQQLLAELGDQLPLLVFAGKYGKGGAEFQEFLGKDAQLAQKVRVVHAPSDLDLAWLYQNCLFTAFPSQFEGWGLPVGEAAWFGKYCVASHATSIPEVCGDLIDYVDPDDLANIKAGIKRPIVDRDFLKQREVRIANAKLRSWSDVADDIYRFACGS